MILLAIFCICVILGVFYLGLHVFRAFLDAIGMETEPGICLARSPYQSLGICYQCIRRIGTDNADPSHLTPHERKAKHTYRTCKVLNKRALYFTSNKFWRNSQRRYRCCWMSTVKRMLSNAEGIQRTTAKNKSNQGHNWDIQWISNGYPRSCIFLYFQNHCKYKSSMVYFFTLIPGVYISFYS